MATKKARKKPAPKAAKKKTNAKAKAKPVKKAAKATKAAPATKKAAPKAMKARKVPETLRLKGFMPSITVNDLAKSLAFYTDALGFIVKDRWTEGEVLRGVMLQAGVCELGVSQDDWKLGRDRKKGEGFRIFCQTGQDIDSIAARVKAAGFTLTQEPADQPGWGMRTFSVDDPDGFHISLARNL